MNTCEPKQYDLLLIFAMGLFILLPFFTTGAAAQSRCSQATQRIYRISETQSQQVPDSLRTLLDLAAFVRTCEPTVSLELDLWLLNKRCLPSTRYPGKMTRSCSSIISLNILSNKRLTAIEPVFTCGVCISAPSRETDLTW